MKLKSVLTFVSCISFAHAAESYFHVYDSSNVDQMHYGLAEVKKFQTEGYNDFWTKNIEQRIDWLYKGVQNNRIKLAVREEEEKKTEHLLGGVAWLRYDSDAKAVHIHQVAFKAARYYGEFLMVIQKVYPDAEKVCTSVSKTKAILLGNVETVAQNPVAQLLKACGWIESAPFNYSEETYDPDVFVGYSMKMSDVPQALQKMQQLMKPKTS